MIKQLETLLTQQGPLTLEALAQALEIPTSALQGMLDLLISKGRVQTISGAARCGTCTSCEAHQQTSYTITNAKAI